MQVDREMWIRGEVESGGVLDPLHGLKQCRSRHQGRALDTGSLTSSQAIAGVAMDTSGAHENSWLNPCIGRLTEVSQIPLFHAHVPRGNRGAGSAGARNARRVMQTRIRAVFDPSNESPRRKPPGSCKSTQRSSKLFLSLGHLLSCPEEIAALPVTWGLISTCRCAWCRALTTQLAGEYGTQSAAAPRPGSSRCKSDETLSPFGRRPGLDCQ